MEDKNRYALLVTALSKKLWYANWHKTLQITQFTECSAELNASLLEKRRTLIKNNY